MGERRSSGEGDVTRDDVDALRQELQSAREEITHLRRATGEEGPPHPGPVMTNVLAGFIVTGGIALLSVTSSVLRTNTPLVIWVVTGVVVGVLMGIGDDRWWGTGKSDEMSNVGCAVQVIGISVVLAGVPWVLTQVTPIEHIIPDEGGQFVMYFVSAVTGMAVYELLKRVGWIDWLQHLWKL